MPKLNMLFKFNLPKSEAIPDISTSNSIYFITFSMIIPTLGSSIA